MKPPSALLGLLLAVTPASAEALGAPVTVPRAVHTATLLRSGEVLIVAGPS